MCYGLRLTLYKIMSMGKSPTQLIYDLRTNLALAKHVRFTSFSTALANGDHRTANNKLQWQRTVKHNLTLSEMLVYISIQALHQLTS